MHCRKSHVRAKKLAICVKIFLGIIVRQHRTDRKLMGLLREQCAESKKGHLWYCCNQVWTKRWWADSMECYCYLGNIQDLFSDGKTPHERRFGVPFNGPIIPFGAMVEYHPISAEFHRGPKES